jgi:hypothetical protein
MPRATVLEKECAFLHKAFFSSLDLQSTFLWSFFYKNNIHMHHFKV